MLVSGFVNGRLIYIFEFPFSSANFADNLRAQLEKKFPGGKRDSGDYLRSATFTYRNFIDDNPKLVYVLPASELESYKDYIDRNFYKVLTGE